MDFKKYILLGCVVFISGCNQISSTLRSFDRCANDQAQNALIDSLKQNSAYISNFEFKTIQKNHQVLIDRQKLNQVLDQISFDVSNINTESSENNRKINTCEAHLNIYIPAKLISQADISRALVKQTDMFSLAADAQLNYQNNKIFYEISYNANYFKDQPYPSIKLKKAEDLINFMHQLSLAIVLKKKRMDEINQQRQLEEQRISESQKISEAYEQVLIAEAEYKLAETNTQLNSIWRSTSEQVRRKISNEQNIWAQKRKLECELNSEGADEPLLFKLNCENNMGIARISELTQKINFLTP